jgi:hypothetical protein
MASRPSSDGIAILRGPPVLIRFRLADFEAVTAMMMGGSDGWQVPDGVQYAGMADLSLIVMPHPQAAVLGVSI